MPKMQNRVEGGAHLFSERDSYDVCVVRESLDDLTVVERQIPVGARLSQIHEEVEDEFRMREDQAHALRRVRMRNRTRRIVTGQRDPSKCLASVAVVKAESESGETHFVARD